VGLRVLRVESFASRRGLIGRLRERSKHEDREGHEGHEGEIKSFGFFFVGLRVLRVESFASRRGLIGCLRERSKHEDREGHEVHEEKSEVLDSPAWGFVSFASKASLPDVV
jgi:hypothetical protein